MSAVTADAAADAIAEPTPALRRKAVFASAIGTTIEWYDFLLYGTAAALVFNKVFFPSADPLTGAMLAFSTYAVGFMARPFGGVIFGHFGDRIGRRQLLIVTLMVMGATTFAIGLLPTFDQVGVAAPIMLIGLRLIQGFGLGGEWGAAILMATEYAEPRKRGLWGGLMQAGGGLGNVLATAILAIMAAIQTPHDFLAWGWRVPFLLSAVLIGVGWWVRLSLAESPVFEAAIKKAEAGVHKAPVIQAIRARPWQVLIGGGLKLGENVSFYLMTTFGITYLTNVLGMTRSQTLNSILAGSICAAATMPLWSALSDKIGRKPVYAFGAAGVGLWAFAFYPLLATKQPLLITGALVAGLIMHSAMNGPQGAMIAELFPTRIRYSGASLAYQVTPIIGGSWAPVISLAIFKATGSTVAISGYLAATCAVSFVCALLAKETKGLSWAEIDREG